MTEHVLELVLACIEDTVTLDEEIYPETPLLEMASFDSLAIQELVDVTETALGVELAAELIMPASFVNARALARAFEASRAALSTASLGSLASGASRQ